MDRNKHLRCVKKKKVDNEKHLVLNLSPIPSGMYLNHHYQTGYWG